MNVFFYDTKIGRIGIADNGKSITNVYFSNEEPSCTYSVKETDLIKEAHRQLDAYLSGAQREFSLPLAPEGTVFMKKVYDALCRIPFGKTATYKDIALVVGSPKAYRAVGLANNKNPIPLFIPCHRVIGSNGKLVGFRAGLDMKKQLLMLEGIDGIL